MKALDGGVERGKITITEMKNTEENMKKHEKQDEN